MKFHFTVVGNQLKCEVWPTENRNDGYSMCLGDKRNEFEAITLAKALNARISNGIRVLVEEAYERGWEHGQTRKRRGQPPRYSEFAFKIPFKPA